MDTPKIGDRVRVFISSRHDFVRDAIILHIDNIDATVQYYDGQIELVPRRWLG